MPDPITHIATRPSHTTGGYVRCARNSIHRRKAKNCTVPMPSQADEDAKQARIAAHAKRVASECPPGESPNEVPRCCRRKR
jgi:hypothetical protein